MPDADATSNRSIDSYGDLCTQFYDLDKPEPPSVEFARLLDQLERTSGPVLEAMSGSGRFLVPLRKRGFEIDGVDASPHMMEACRERCIAESLPGGLYQQFLQDLDLPRKYGFIFITGGSFSLIPERQQALESLRRVRAHLLEDGAVAIEILADDDRPARESRDWRRENGSWRGRWVDRPDGKRILLSELSLYDAERQIAEGTYRYELISDGELLATEFETMEMRLYRIEQFEELMAEAGFGHVEARIDSDGEHVARGDLVAFYARP